MPDRPARRSFLTGLGIALAMPAIVLTPGMLMRVRPRRMFTVADFELMMQPWAARSIADDRDRLSSRNLFLQHIGADYA